MSMPNYTRYVGIVIYIYSCLRIIRIEPEGQAILFTFVHRTAQINCASSVIGVMQTIKLGKCLDKYSMAWIRIPAQFGAYSQLNSDL